MAEKLDPRQVVTFEELLRAMMFETEATRRVLVRKRCCPRGSDFKAEQFSRHIETAAAELTWCT